MKIKKLSILILYTIAGITLLSGCKHTKKDLPSHTFRFYLESSDRFPSQWARTIRMPESEAEFSIFPQPVLWEGDVANIELVEVELGYCLLFQFSHRGSKQLYQLSFGNKGSVIALFINDQPIGFRQMDQPIEGGDLYMFVELPDEDLSELVTLLRESLVKIKKLKAKMKA